MQASGRERMRNGRRRARRRGTERRQSGEVESEGRREVSERSSLGEGGIGREGVMERGFCGVERNFDSREFFGRAVAADFETS